MGDDPIHGLCRLPDSLGDDLAQFREMTEQFASGDISAEQYKAFGVPQGVYEQRKDGQFMLRMRLTAGVVTPEQMRALADAAEKHGSGVLHATTRQDIQVHGVPLDGICPALTDLAEAGLAAKGGGGNAVRNISACSQAGVCPYQVFDVTGHAAALTEFLLTDPSSFTLPRKYKLAFSGCGNDCAGATMNDVGFIAKRRDGVDGFAVYAAGGMGSRSRVGQLLEECVPAAAVPLVAEAVKRVFGKHGDRENRNKARIRFLVDRIGFEAFIELYRAELRILRAAPPECPSPRSLPHPTPTAQPADQVEPRVATAEFDAWRQANVTLQKDAGYHMVAIPLTLGDIPAVGLRGLAGVVAGFGERTLRTTQSQNFVIRWVRGDELLGLHASLSELGLADSGPRILRDIVACAGAATCRLGICQSRGLAGAVAEALVAGDLDLPALGALKIHISGCPNACGRHPIADIGLFGGSRKRDGRAVPHYTVQLGGVVAEGKTRLAEGRLRLPARNVPAFLVAFLQAFQQSPAHPDFPAFLVNGGRGRAEELAAGCAAVPSFEEDPGLYYDWGADEPFALKR